MAGRRDVALKNLEKARLSPNAGKRGPSKSTLEKLEARRIYLEKLSERFDKIIDMHFAEAEKPENVMERKEVIHQAVGKPTEKIEIEGEVGLKLDM